MYVYILYHTQYGHLHSTLWVTAFTIRTNKILYLQSAFDEMIKILRFLNQSMDVVGLKGFPVR